MLTSRPLGDSGIQVSRLALGSWRTFERIPRETGVSVMRQARALGINFLDDARYNDETGKAPLKTGYSEVVFGELFRASGWRREDVVIANKLWWEFWPEQRAAEELDGSLERMGLDHVDLIYSEQPPDGLSMEELVHAVGALIQAGKARAWGVLNWSPGLIADATRVGSVQGVDPPRAAQLAYSLVRRSMVEDPQMEAALDSAGAGVVASFTLDGGALTGKYRTPGAGGRLEGSLESERYRAALSIAPELERFAGEHGAKPAQAAIAFALLNPRVTSVLFGATSAEQVADNTQAVALLDRLDEGAVRRLRSIGGSARPT